jgi:hypothetical protein
VEPGRRPPRTFHVKRPRSRRATGECGDPIGAAVDAGRPWLASSRSPIGGRCGAWWTIGAAAPGSPDGPDRGTSRQPPGTSAPRSGGLDPGIRRGLRISSRSISSIGRSPAPASASGGPPPDKGPRRTRRFPARHVPREAQRSGPDRSPTSRCDHVPCGTATTGWVGCLPGPGPGPADRHPGVGWPPALLLPAPRGGRGPLPQTTPAERARTLPGAGSVGEARRCQAPGAAGDWRPVHTLGARGAGSRAARCLAHVLHVERPGASGPPAWLVESSSTPAPPSITEHVVACPARGGRPEPRTACLTAARRPSPIRAGNVPRGTRQPVDAGTSRSSRRHPPRSAVDDGPPCVLPAVAARPSRGPAGHAASQAPVADQGRERSTWNTLTTPDRRRDGADRPGARRGPDPAAHDTGPATSAGAVAAGMTAVRPGGRTRPTWPAPSGSTGWSARSRTGSARRDAGCATLIGPARKEVRPCGEVAAGDRFATSAPGDRRPDHVVVPVPQAVAHPPDRRHRPRPPTAPSSPVRSRRSGRGSPFGPATRQRTGREWHWRPTAVVTPAVRSEEGTDGRARSVRGGSSGWPRTLDPHGSGRSSAPAPQRAGWPLAASTRPPARPAVGSAPSDPGPRRCTAGRRAASSPPAGRCDGDPPVPGPAASSHRSPPSLDHRTSPVARMDGCDSQGRVLQGPSSNTPTIDVFHVEPGAIETTASVPGERSSPPPTTARRTDQRRRPGCRAGECRPTIRRRGAWPGCPPGGGSAPGTATRGRW